VVFSTVREELIEHTSVCSCSARCNDAVTSESDLHRQARTYKHPQIPLSRRVILVAIVHIFWPAPQKFLPAKNAYRWYEL